MYLSEHSEKYKITNLKIENYQKSSQSNQFNKYPG